MLPSTLTEPAAAVARLLTERRESIAVAESAAGGLIAAALVAVPGASAYFAGGAVIYTLDGAQALVPGGPELPSEVEGASEPFAHWLAASAAATLNADWAIGETGASGPQGNRYGASAGQAWVAVRGPGGRTSAREVQTGSADRAQNMAAFAAAALTLLHQQLS